MIKWYGEKFTREVEKVNNNKLMRACLLVERKAKKLCPVLTGTLKRSIISNWSGSKRARSVSWPEVDKKVKDKTVHIKGGKTHLSEPPEGVGVVGTNVEYAAHVELGTKHQAAHSYLRSALSACRCEIKRLYSR